MTRVLLWLLLGTTVSYAVDQTILGTQLVVKDPGVPEKRTVAGAAKESASPNTIEGDPTVDGATLVVRADGANPSEQTFTLPQGTNDKGKPFWTGDALAGFKYNDSKGANGPVKQVGLKKSKGVFTLKFRASGKLGSVLVVPPNPGDGGCILLALTGGDSYSVRFAPGDGTASNKGGASFSVKKPMNEGSCVTTSTTSTSTTSSTSSTTSTSSTSSTSSTTATTIFAGPAFPPVGGDVSYSFTGNPQTPGGSNLSLFGFSPSTWTALYWGSWTAPSGPQAGLDGSLHALSFAGLSGGDTVATWQGISPWTNPGDMTVYNVPVRLTVSLVTPPSGVVWVDSTAISGLDPGAATGVGAVVDVAPSGVAQDFSVTFEFTADIPTDDPTGFIAFSNVPQIGGGLTQSSFSGGFYSQP